MTKALISIDYTEDFVADSGKLTAGAPAQAISDAISKVTRLALNEETTSSLLLMLMKKTIVPSRKQTISSSQFDWD